MLSFMLQIYMILLYHLNAHIMDDYPEQYYHQNIISNNYTLINGETIHYSITEDGYWHTDPCTIIGDNKNGLRGYYKELSINKRRLSPYNSNPNQHWPGGVIPVDYDGYPGGFDINLWNAVVNEYKTKTGITIIKRTNEVNYVKIIDGSGCFSDVGMIGGKQILSLKYPECISNFNTVIHEFGHALGLWHTHTRSDRDSYVVVNDANIEAANKHNFDVKPGPVCGCYDCGSVMHYPMDAFSKDGQSNTITPINPNTCIIERNIIHPLSINDINCIQKIYFNTDDACNSVSPTIDRGTVTMAPTYKPTNVARATNVNDYFCLSGGNRVDSVSEALFGYAYNGEYKLTGQFNGKNYYVQSRQSQLSALFYVYWNIDANLWFLALSLGGDEWANCNINDVSLCPFWVREDEQIPYLTTTKGECLRARCGTIDVFSTYIDSIAVSCRGRFSYVTDNLFYNGLTKMYWSYNDVLSQWICSFSISGVQRSSTALASEASDAVSQPNIIDGVTLKIKLLTGVPNGGNETLFISCNGCNGTQLYCPVITEMPTITPTFQPSIPPTTSPSIAPTIETLIPSVSPSMNPTSTPTVSPSIPPTNTPTITPTIETSLPSVSPTLTPTAFPSVSPSTTPTAIPTTSPTLIPSTSPTETPTNTPSKSPTVEGYTYPPTVSPSIPPTTSPSQTPTTSPIISPTAINETSIQTTLSNDNNQSIGYLPTNSVLLYTYTFCVVFLCQFL